MPPLATSKIKSHWEEWYPSGRPRLGPDRTPDRALPSLQPAPASPLPSSSQDLSSLQHSLPQEPCPSHLCLHSKLLSTFSLFLQMEGVLEKRNPTRQSCQLGSHFWKLYMRLTQNIKAGDRVPKNDLQSKLQHLPGLKPKKCTNLSFSSPHPSSPGV